MDNQKNDINPWAKKLEQAATPENDGWSSLETLLDRNMPVQKSKSGKRGLLTTIFLLLLIGVCNYPGIKTANRITLVQNNQTKTDSIRNHSQESFMTKKSNLNNELTQNQNPNSEYVSGRENNLTSASSMRLNKTKNRRFNSGISETASGQQTQTEFQPGLAIDSPEQKTTTAKKDSARTDSHTNAKSIAKTKTESPVKKNPDKVPEDKKGFAFTLGLNQFLPVGSQDKTNYNSNGTTGGISDYIPVPAGRYYFHNWLYLEAELQINSPQYTNSLLVDQKIGFSTSQPLVQSVYIRKLFYFNIPLSIHFSPVKNLFFGAGIQYSLLTNGVALYQGTNYTSGYTPNRPINDTGLVYSEVRDFKNDTSYQKLKTSEWRFLLDVNYQWKRLTLGLRYNQAFNNFINVQVSSNTITQAHNSSLQLYLQYMLWDNRKKIKKTSP